MTGSLKIIAKYGTPEEAHLIRNRLEAAGIPAFLDGEMSAGGERVGAVRSRKRLSNAEPCPLKKPIILIVAVGCAEVASLTPVAGSWKRRCIAI